jgi:hypothetical protein
MGRTFLSLLIAYFKTTCSVTAPEFHGYPGIDTLLAAVILENKKKSQRAKSGQ